MIISIINQKGGVAKTTTTHNLAVALSKMDKKVLLIDLDPQASLTLSVGVKPNELKLTVNNVLCDNENINNSILTLEHFDLVPSTIALSSADMVLINKFGRENILKKAIQKGNLDYDYILLDCPPSFGILTINALTSCDKALVPVATEYLSLMGMHLLLDTVKNIKENLNEHLDILGIVPTFYDSRTLHSREVLDKLKEDYKDLVFEPITKSVQVQDAIFSRSCIVHENPEHKISKAYINIAEVIING